jgi:hypothetical protein
MNPASVHQRSSSEAVFAILRVLMASYRLWGARGGLTLDDLTAFLDTHADRVAESVAFLLREGLVAVRAEAGTIRLSEEGVDQLVRSVGDGAARRAGASATPIARVSGSDDTLPSASPHGVVFPPGKWH